MIFEQKTSMDIINAALEKKFQLNPHYSYHSFAKRAGISQSYLSLILKKKRKITHNVAKKVVHALGLSELEVKYFQLLLSSEINNDEGQKSYFKNKISEFHRQYHQTILDLEKFKMIQDWRYSAILECVLMAQTKNIPFNAKGFAKLLGLTMAQINESLNKLIDLKLIEKTENGYRRIDTGLIESPTEIPSESLRNFHKQVMHKAIKAVDDQDTNRRSFSGMTMSINTKKLPEAKLKIQNFIKELSEFLEDDNRDEVYQLSVGLFSLFENIKTKLQ
jgi:uncharacterized protein (TIGR02147 family)